MRSHIDIELPRDEAATLLASLSLALATVDDARIRKDDLLAAGRVGLSLRAHRGATLRLSVAAAENLLALCDAVHGAVDDSRPVARALAPALEAFGTFRFLVYCACSTPARAARAVA